MTESRIQRFLDDSVKPPIQRSLSRASTPEGAIREALTIATYLALIYGFWLYSNKFLGMSADYITSMSRSIVVNGNQANLSCDSVTMRKTWRTTLLENMCTKKP